MNECSHYRQRRLYRLINHHPFTNAHRNQMECSHTRPVSFIHVGFSAKWSRYYFSRALIKLSSIVRITKWSWSAARWSAVYLCPVGSIASVAVLLPPRICINVVIPALSSFMICLEMQCSFKWQTRVFFSVWDLRDQTRFLHLVEGPKSSWGIQESNTRQNY